MSMWSNVPLLRGAVSRVSRPAVMLMLCEIVIRKLLLHDILYMLCTWLVHVQKFVESAETARRHEIALQWGVFYPSSVTYSTQ